MAYLDKNAARRPNIAATAAVIAIEAALVVAVVQGLAVSLSPRERPWHTGGEQIPLPQPTPTPKASESPRPHDPIRDPHPVPVPSTPPLGTGAGPLSPPDPFPSPIPSPLPTFQPPQPSPSPVSLARPAMPRGNPASWVSDSDYPARDLREGNQGRVGFALSLGADGRVASCRVTASSGHPGLDEATCTLVARRARFTPAMGADGRPGAGSYSGTIRWVIPD